MKYERILFEIVDNIAVLRLNHPEVLNAVGSQMVEELNDVLFEISSDDSPARCLLITGEGRAFCSGANLADPDRSRRRGGARENLRRNYHPLLLGLRDLDMPIVTAVHGPAAGVGMSFALMGDIICASRQAYFLQAFARIGLVPDGGATFMLPRLIGWGRAVELSMLAEKLPAEKAHEWGLVNRLYDDQESLMEGAMDVAGRLAKGPRSLALIRRAYWATWQNTLEQQLDLEARLQGKAGLTEDAKEGTAAFLEKREARFTGR
jgi:2-(1,2-epoxy-1,2-dihydrophenyl)acetyl-CoA isomerase